jgi:uncharacterized membrane protein YfcA
MEGLGYVASLLMGLSLGMIGGGGSILTVPILVYLFHVQPLLASGYSLFIVGLTALLGSFAYIKQGQVDLKIGAVFALPSFIGVYSVRSLLLPSLPDPVLSWGALILSKNLTIMLVFALLMIAASYSMIRPVKIQDASREVHRSLPIHWVALEGLLVGGVTGLVGAGGGFLIIPALVLLVGLPMKKAVGTSLLIIAVKSLFGFLGDVQQQASIDWNFLLTLASIAVAGIYAGTYLSRFISETKLKKAFGWFVAIMGTTILFEQLRHL